MKKLSIMLIAPVFVFGLLTSCGGGGKEYSEDSNEATEGTMEEEGPVYSGKTAVGVVHTVADFSAWVKVYEEVSVPEGRIAYYENVDNPSEIVVFELTTSHEEAKAGFASEDLKADMERAGVTNEPAFIYYDMKYMNDTQTDAIYRAGIGHEVQDYESWKEKFDADEARRAEAGLVLMGLATDADNPNMVYIMWATNDLEPIKGMLQDPELKVAMDDAGVISEPVATFWKVPDSN